MTVHVSHQAPRARPPAALIAQAPGNTEVRFEITRRNKGQRGFPIVGPSSFALGRALAYMSPPRERWDYLIDNVFDRAIANDEIATICQPTPAMENGFSDEFTRQVMRAKVPGGKGYLKEEGWAQLSRLYENIRKYDPPVLVALGAFAAFALAGRTVTLKRERGTIIQSHLKRPNGEPYPLIPSYHPSPRNAKNAPLLMFDLIKAERLRKGELSVEMPERQILVPQYLDEVVEVLDELESHEVIAVDIETTRGRGFIKSIQFAPSDRISVDISLFDPEKGPIWNEEPHVFIVKCIRNLLEARYPKKIFQNGPFDTQWLFENWGIRTRGYAYDTKLMSHALFTELPRDLGTLGANYANEKAWKHLSGETSEEKMDD